MPRWAAFSGLYRYTTSFGFVKIDEKCGLAVFDAGNSPATGRLFNLGGNGAVTPNPNFGPVTRFKVTTVAEPLTISLVGIGVLVFLVCSSQSINGGEHMRHFATTQGGNCDRVVTQ